MHQVLEEALGRPPSLLVLSYNSWLTGILQRQ